MWVDPLWRRQGIGRALLEAVFAWADRIVAYIQTELRDDTLHVRMLCVVPEYQSQGIGSALLKGFIHDYSAKRLDVTLGVFKINTEARRFHERLSFEVIEATSTHYLMRRNTETIVCNPLAHTT